MEPLRNLVVLVAMMLVLVWAGAARAGKSGKEIFLDQKCAKCHSIQSQGIVKSEEKEAGEEDAFSMEEEADDTVEPPDLSDAGKKHDSDWTTKWLQKKVQNEDGRKHRERFKGDDADLKVLVEFLSGLRAEGASGGR